MELNGLAILAIGLLGLNPTAGWAADSVHTLTCAPDKTIGEALKHLKPGDTLRVTGNCEENLVVPAEVERVVLDGQGLATIAGIDSGENAVTVAGREITIRGFVITGGAHGIAVQDGGHAVIDGNTIDHAGKSGVFVLRNSTARIINNTIEHNPNAGISVGHGSSALIGFIGAPMERESKPNIIRSNGGPAGIQVQRNSHAQIFTNTIRDNTGHGVLVDRNSQIEIAACLITGNGGDGIRATRNAGVEIGTDATGAPPFDNDTNTGTNGRFGLSCAVDGYVDGNRGLTGTSGPTDFREDCTDSTEP